ncbi:MAG TPA: RsmE family RNA methyltransferase [Puia sp.]|nr:RsmE family RNA methyltransferase [Puia sp.]
MEVPFFYTQTAGDVHELITLDEDNSKHIIQVSRMKVDQPLLLTDGRGNLISGTIAEGHKKKCVVKVLETKYKAQRSRKTSIAISLLKNPNRFEWFLEKSTELGITEIIPITCKRTEKLHFRSDRMRNILISAMLQSQQVWLPELQHPTDLEKIISEAHHAQKFIAHCADDAKIDLAEAINSATDSQIILIGPEGDFTDDEIDQAKKNHFLPVTLGETRLRTETAGIVAAALLTR